MSARLQLIHAIEHVVTEHWTSREEPADVATILAALHERGFTLQHVYLREVLRTIDQRPGATIEQVDAGTGRTVLAFKPAATHAQLEPG